MTKIGNKAAFKPIVLITGVETKLSYDLAQTYAQRNMEIMVQSDAENSGLLLDLLVHDIVSQGGTAVPCYHPIRHTKKIMKDIKKHFDRIDIIIVKVPDGVDMNEWKSDYENQLQVVFRLVHECMEYFKNQKFGRIVFVTSHRGILDSISSTTFNSAKYALLGLCQSVAAVGKPDNVYCNTLLVEDIKDDEDDEFNEYDYEKNEKNIELIMNLTIPESTETGTILSSRDRLLYFKEYSKLQSLTATLNDDILKDQVAVITGSSSGIGFYLVKALLKIGATVIAYENNMLRQWSRPNFEQTKESKRIPINLLSSKRNRTVKKAKLEFIDNLDEAQLIDFVMERYGRIDILFNASTVPVAPRHSEIHEYYWKLMLRQRLESSYKISQLVLPIMQKQGYGRIVFSGPNLCCEAIRYGLIGLVKGISESLDNARHSIKVNSLFLDAFGELNHGDVAAFLACQLIVPATLFQNQFFEVRNATLAELQFQYHIHTDHNNNSLVPHDIQINYRSYSISFDYLPQVQ